MWHNGDGCNPRRFFNPSKNICATQVQLVCSVNTCGRSIILSRQLTLWRLMNFVGLRNRKIKQKLILMTLAQLQSFSSADEEKSQSRVENFFNFFFKLQWALARAFYSLSANFSLWIRFTWQQHSNWEKFFATHSNEVDWTTRGRNLFLNTSEVVSTHAWSFREISVDTSDTRWPIAMSAWLIPEKSFRSVTEMEWKLIDGLNFKELFDRCQHEKV